MIKFSQQKVQNDQNFWIIMFQKLETVLVDLYKLNSTAPYFAPRQYSFQKPSGLKLIDSNLKSKSTELQKRNIKISLSNTCDTNEDQIDDRHGSKLERNNGDD